MRIINAATAKHEHQLRVLAEVLELDSIEYKDLDSFGENYILTRNNKSVTLQIRSNRDQGGFLVIPEAFNAEI